MKKSLKIIFSAKEQETKKCLISTRYFYKNNIFYHKTEHVIQNTILSQNIYENEIKH